MGWKKIVLMMVLADFTVMTAYAVYVSGYLGFFEMVTANWATTAVLADLVIALSLIAVWMWGDAKKRGVSPVPYALLTLTLGSIGPLLYLIRHGDDDFAALPAEA